MLPQGKRNNRAQMQEERIRSNTTGLRSGVPFNITVYTDPLCCWSWAMQQELDSLKQELAGKTVWSSKMGGLIPSWNNYYDETNSVSRPVQMGPVWMHAATVANKSICHELWMKDAPASSYPACIAVKCAQLQSELAGEVMLQLLRDAAMANGKNIAKPDVILETAEKATSIASSFDVARFVRDYNGGAGSNAFKEDLQECQYHRINRFPSLLVRSAEGKTILLQGFRTLPDLRKQISSVFGLEM